MYLRFPVDNGVYTRDPDYGGPPESEEVFRCVCGIGLEFPTSQTLPRQLAAQAALEFFQTGQLPRCVPWDLDRTTVSDNDRPERASELPTSEDKDVPF
jgi:hypothetical protein